MTGNSRGNPPAWSTPRLTASARPRRWTLQLTSSDQLLQIPISGRPRNVSSPTPVDFSHERCRNPSRSRRSSHSELRRPLAFSYPPLRMVGMAFLSESGVLEDDLRDYAVPVVHQAHGFLELSRRETMGDDPVELEHAVRDEPDDA